MTGWFFFVPSIHAQQQGQVHVLLAINMQYKSYNYVGIYFFLFTVVLYCIVLSFLFANIINGAQRHIVFIAGLHMIISLT